MTGKTITHYRLFESLGKGGMGEVYRAEDRKLRRQVAVKVLAAEMASDRERLARFEREAHLLAALNHPNVAAIYGLETEEANPFLVMELVEGETLQERIAQGPLSREQVLDVFSQIANGLEAAHEKGVIHRDLKPANIKITSKGVVKILDFGLAKVFDSPQPDLSQSPTLTGTTQAGVILGTAAYMSPEQAKGQPVERSGDVWAFGCILYEALTGQKAFDGDSVTEILAAVLRADPDPGLLPEGLPAGLERLLRLCLKKDPSQRIRDIRDVRIQLVSSLQESEPATKPVPPKAPPQQAFARPLFLAPAGLLIGLLAGLLIASLGSDPGPAPGQPVQRFQVRADGLVLAGSSSSVAVSPDGSRIVYVGGEDAQLFQRPLNRVESTALPSTEGAIGPFFSPDSQWIGFWADDRLKKMSVSGGAPRTICRTGSVVIGATWAGDGNIYFSSSGQEGSPLLWRVPAAGGKPETLLVPADEEGQKRVLLWPQALPDRRAIIFTNLPFEPVPEEGRVELLQLDQPDARPQTLVEGAFYGRYAPTGHIVAAWPGGLVSIPFDAEKLQTAQSQLPVVDDIFLADAFVPHFDFSQNGTLVYVAGSSRAGRNSLLWVDRQENRNPAASDLKGFLEPRISPDGRQLAVAVAEDDGRNIWIYDLERGTALKPITFEGFNTAPAWSPDGGLLAFSSSKGGPQKSLVIQPTDGSGRARQLYEADYLVHAADWSSDGKEVIVQEFDQSGDSDLRIVDLQEGEVRDYLATPFAESNPRLSPDGQWLAYQSDQSGADEVYIRAYPGPGQEIMVSRGGGSSPFWGQGESEVFYRYRSRLMAVEVKAGSRPEVSEPRTVLPNLRPEESVAELSPDGQRFLLLKREEQSRDIQLRAVLNWFQELERRPSR